MAIICILTVGLELTGLVPFDGDGHWYLYLDYRHNNTQPEITFIETESDYEKPIAKPFKNISNYLKLTQTMNSSLKQILQLKSW